MTVIYDTNVILPFVCSIQRMVLTVIYDSRIVIDTMFVAIMLVVLCYSLMVVILVLFTSFPFY